MAVEDLHYRRDGSPTKRHGRGLRWRVTVAGYPSTAHRTKAEAERVHAQRVIDGPPKPASTTTVGECLDVWLAGKVGMESEKSFQHTARVVRARWGRTPVGDVDADDVQSWLNGLQSQDRKGGGLHPASASTRLKALQGLRAALAVAVRRDWLAADPTTKHVRVPKVAAREPRYLTMAELHALAVASSAPETIWLMGTCGPRSGEVAALNVGDVVKRRGGTRLRIRRSKNGEPRDVPVPAQVLAMLDLSRPSHEPLLTAPMGGRLQMRNWRARVFDPAVAASGVDPALTPHDLRHTAVSLAIASGADIKVVQRIAGHKTGTMTVQTYGHLIDDSLDAVAERMNAQLESVLTLNLPA